MQFQLGSAQQVSQLLYKHLKVPVPTIANKYKSGDFSVSKDDLEVGLARAWVTWRARSCPLQHGAARLVDPAHACCEHQS